MPRMCDCTVTVNAKRKRGLDMRILIVGLMFALIAAGCKKDEPAKQPPVAQNPKPNINPNPNPPVVKPKPSLISAVARRIDRPERQNELKQIGTFYQLIRTERGRPPADLKDFMAYCQRDIPGICKAIEEGYYVVVPNIKSGNGVIAYEREPDIHDMHLAILADLSVHTVTTGELKAGLQAK